MVGVCLSFVKGFQLWETPLTHVNGMLSSTGNVQSLLCVLSCLSASVIVWTRFLVFFIFACLSRAFWRQHDFKVCSFQSLEAPCKRYKTVNRFEDKLSPGNCLIRSFWLFIFWIWCTSFAIFSFTRFQHMLPRDWGYLYDIAWRTRGVRRGSVWRGGRHLLSRISVNSLASRTSRAWNQQTLQRLQWIHRRRITLLATNIPETYFSQEKYNQYKITKIDHIMEVKKQIMPAVLFFEKS